jgi:hypothetical protein
MMKEDAAAKEWTRVRHCWEAVRVNSRQQVCIVQASQPVSDLPGEQMQPM